jgi:hypothetical protein
MNARRWFSGALAVISAALLMLTLTWPQWIEGIFGVEPDSGDGSFELMVVLGLAALAVASSAEVIAGWRRARLRRPPPSEPDRFVEG